MSICWNSGFHRESLARTVFFPPIRKSFPRPGCCKGECNSEQSKPPVMRPDVDNKGSQCCPQWSLPMPITSGTRGRITPSGSRSEESLMPVEGGRERFLCLAHWGVFCQRALNRGLHGSRAVLASQCGLRKQPCVLVSGLFPLLGVLSYSLVTFLLSLKTFIWLRASSGTGSDALLSTPVESSTFVCCLDKQSLISCLQKTWI